jgi:hypothetical protein
MRLTAMAALVGAQIAIAAPAGAAELLGEQSAGPQLRGAFAGARLRVPLGGTRETPHGGLAFAMTARDADGASPRFSRGVEFGYAGGTGMRLSLNGRAFAPSGVGPDGPRMGVSTIGWIAIGVGALAVVVVAAGVTCQETNCLNSE